MKIQLDAELIEEIKEARKFLEEKLAESAQVKAAAAAEIKSLEATAIQLDSRLSAAKAAAPASEAATAELIQIERRLQLVAEKLEMLKATSAGNVPTLLAAPILREIAAYWEERLHELIDRDLSPYGLPNEVKSTLIGHAHCFQVLRIMREFPYKSPALTEGSAGRIFQWLDRALAGAINLNQELPQAAAQSDEPAPVELQNPT